MCCVCVCVFFLFWSQLSFVLRPLGEKEETTAGREHRGDTHTVAHTHTLCHTFTLTIFFMFTHFLSYQTHTHSHTPLSFRTHIHTFVIFTFFFVPTHIHTHRLRFHFSKSHNMNTHLLTYSTSHFLHSASDTHKQTHSQSLVRCREVPGGGGLWLSWRCKCLSLILDMSRVISKALDFCRKG